MSFAQGWNSSILYTNTTHAHAEVEGFRYSTYQEEYIYSALHCDLWLGTGHSNLCVPRLPGPTKWQDDETANDVDNRS